MSRISRAAVALLLTLGLMATFAATPRADEMPAVRVLTAALSNEAEAIAQRLAGALRFKTISYQDSADFRPEPFDELNAYLRKTYPATYAALDTQVVAGYSLLLEWKGSDASLPPALFLSHTDVVPIEPGTEEGWSHPPFAGTVADGYIWGRGTLDTKESVLAYHEAIERLLGEGWSPKRSLFFAFGHDEEIGGRAGAGAIAALLAERGVHFEFGVDEGGFILDGFEQIPDRHVALISTAEKTYFTVELVARGPGGHSSMPPVRSSVGRLATALDKLEKEQMDLKLCEPVREQLERMAPELSFGRRLALQNLWLFKGLVMRGLTGSRTSNAMVRTTTALTLVSAGVKENVVPQEARASVNFRILPCETPDDVLEHVRRTIDDPDIEIKPKAWSETARPARLDTRAWNLLADAAREAYPDALALPNQLSGGTDTRHYRELADDLYRFVGVKVSAEDITGAHGTDERIGVDSYVNAVGITTGILRRAAE